VSDQTPEARLAAALEEVGVLAPTATANMTFAADPTLAADLALAAAVRERFPNMTLAIEEDLDREHAARADADRLAEALRTIDVFRFHLEARHWDKAREALRQHDAAKEAERE